MLIKEDFEKRLKNLQSSRTECKAMMMENTTRREELNDKIIETRNKSLCLENDIAKISEQLDTAAMDACAVSQQMKKVEIIKMLKQFPGVVCFLLIIVRTY